MIGFASKARITLAELVDKPKMTLARSSGRFVADKHGFASKLRLAFPRSAGEQEHILQGFPGSSALPKNSFKAKIILVIKTSNYY